MRRILSSVVVFALTLFFVALGWIREHPVIMYAGIIIGGLLALALVAFLFKLLLKIIGKTLTSVLSLLALGATSYSLIRLGMFNGLVDYFTGLALGSMITLFGLRWLAKKAHSSMIFGELFSFFTGYQLKTYIVRNSLQTTEDKTAESNDLKNIMQVLIDQMKYTRKEASLAAKYAVEHTPLETPIEDKIKQAIQYQGINN